MTKIDETAIEAVAKALYDIDPMVTPMVTWDTIHDQDGLWDDLGEWIPPKEHYRQCVRAVLATITEAGYRLVAVPPMEPTFPGDRGFATYDDFPDMLDNRVVVHESSIINGGVWILSYPKYPQESANPHLDEAGIDRLIAALIRAKDRQYGDGGVRHERRE